VALVDRWADGYYLLEGFSPSGKTRIDTETRQQLDKELGKDSCLS
jgi:hypothetical protein